MYYMGFPSLGEGGRGGCGVGRRLGLPCPGAPPSPRTGGVRVWAITAMGGGWQGWAVPSW